MSKAVLVVEDQPELRQLVCLFLSELFDVNIYEATNGIEALAILDEQAGVALVITDLNMPEMDGLEMTAKIRERAELTTLPIIMLTSEGESLRATAMEAGVTVFMNKPMRPESLMPEVHNYLSA